jgi:hypothetical protein
MLVGYSQKWKSLCAISELFVGWKSYTTASSPARKLLLIVFWKTKAFSFLNSWTTRHDEEVKPEVS